jgi:hypothetical protein
MIQISGLISVINCHLNTKEDHIFTTNPYTNMYLSGTSTPKTKDQSFKTQYIPIYIQQTHVHKYAKKTNYFYQYSIMPEIAV